MNNREPQWDDLGDLLNQARRELHSIEPVRSRVETRLDTARIWPRRFTIGRASAVVATAMLSVGWLIVHHHREVPPQNSTSAIDQACESSVALGNMEVTEHVAAILDRQKVLVVWSSRGAAHSQPSEAPVTRVGKYRRRLLRQTNTHDGRLLTCELFVADEGVHLALEPPAIVARSPSEILITLGTSPKALSNDQLNKVLANPDVGLRVEDLTLGRPVASP